MPRIPRPGGGAERYVGATGRPKDQSTDGDSYLTHQSSRLQRTAVILPQSDELRKSSDDHPALMLNINRYTV